MTTTADPNANAANQPDHLLYELDGHVATITLNRPDRMNAISSAMLEALSAQLVACQKDPQVRAIILTGAGRGFCAGLDLQDQGERIQQDGESGVVAGYSLFDWRDAPPTVIYRMDKPGGNGWDMATTLQSVCGPGDDAEPVITIMGMDED